MRPTLRQLQYLVAIADTGRFHKAARVLNVSQPALSAQVAEMEAFLGAPLVERGAKGARLTETGADIVARARLVLQEVEQIQQIARQRAAPFAGRLRLGVLPSIGAYFLPIATRRLHAIYPDLRLFIEEGSTTALRAGLTDGAFDVIISTPGDDADLEHIPLFSETLWICTAPDDPLMAETSPVTLPELAGRPLISLGPGFRLSQIIENLATLAGAHVSSEYRGVSLDAARQMSVMGAGVAVLPSLYALGEAVRDPDFNVRRIDHPEAVHDIALFWRRSSPFGEAFAQLAEELIAIKQTIPDDLPESLSPATA
ncbi:LysR family transcriptional regulator [bacterium]|nr:LysR family transcriptional regulator [bacterium]